MSKTTASDDSNYFEEAAETWDQDSLVLELADAVAASLLAHLVLHDELVVMEYGCGTGLIAEAIAPRVKHLHAWDSSPAMLSVLEAKLRKGANGKISTKCIDLTADEISGEKFDLVYSSMALHHVRDTERLLGKLYRLLVPGGCIALVDLDVEDGSFHGDNPGVHHHGFQRDEIERQLTTVGFRSIGQRTAYCFEKPDESGITKKYSLFLMTGYVAAEGRLGEFDVPVSGTDDLSSSSA